MQRHCEQIHKGESVLKSSYISDPVYQTLISKIDQLEESNKQLKVELIEQIGQKSKKYHQQISQIIKH